MLPYVNAGADGRLAVYEKRERETEVAFVGIPAGLHEPFAQAHKIARQKTALDEVVQRLEQERPAFVRQAALP